MVSHSVNLSWDTGGVQPKERFDYFVEGICRAFTHLDPEISDGEETFCFNINHREVGDAKITTLKNSRYIVRRRKSGILRHEDNDFYLNYLVFGTINADQAECTLTVSDGDIFILDNANPFLLDVRSPQVFDSRVVRLRRSARLEANAGHLIDFGKRFAHHRLMPLLRLNLVQLAKAGPTASDAAINYFGLTIETLVDLILTESAGERWNTKHENAWHVIIAEINQSLTDPLFSLEHLSQRLGVSSRTIQKIFASRGDTFSDYLRNQRLAKALRRLHEANQSVSIENIAYASGFCDLSTFYRSFRRKYGAKPGDFRP